MRGEGEQAVEGGEALQCAADEHDQHASTIDGDQQKVHTLTAQHGEQAQAGREQSEQGQAKINETNQSTQETQANAEGQQSKGAGTKMPAQPKSESIWDRVADWFQKQIFDRVAHALDWVRQGLSKIILKVVGMCMGMDNINDELAKVSGEMDESEQHTAETTQGASEVDQQAGAAHTQASEASTHAQQAVSEGSQQVQQAEASEQALAAEDQALAQQEQEVEAYCSQYATDNASYFGEDAEAGQSTPPDQPPPIDGSVLQAAEAEASGGADLIDQQEHEAMAAAARARNAIQQDALACGVSPAEALGAYYQPMEDAVVDYTARQDTRRAALAAAGARITGLSGQSREQADPMLSDLASEVVRTIGAAEADHAALMQGLRDALQSAGQGFESTSSEQGAEQSGALMSAPDAP